MGEILYGGLASMMAAMCTHPLDLLKVRLQTQRQLATAGKAQGSVLVATVRGVVAERGILGFYQGLSASLLRQGTYSTIRFATYDYIKEQMERSNAGAPLLWWQKIGVSMFAGVMGGIAGTPADITNIRMQADTQLPPHLRRNYRHAFHGLSVIARTEGVTALWTGVGPNIVRAALMTAGQVATYEQAKQFALSNKLMSDGPPLHFVSSFVAGFVATLVTQPVDVIKTRVMNASKGETTSALQCVMSIVRQERLSTFFKGFWPAFTRLGPQTILTFVFKEQLINFFSLFHAGSSK